jgi:60 kDa SS-A/Ro ribonucleoprotein
MTRLADVVSTVSSTPSLKATTVNKEGFVAFEKDLEEKYLQTLLTNTFGKTFYTTEREVVSESIKLHNDMVNKDPAFMANALVYARNEGYMRSQPIYGLAVLARKGATDAKAGLAESAARDHFKRIFNHVIKTPKDLLDFVTVVDTMRGWGNSIRKQVRQWLSDKMSVYWAIKYGSLKSGTFTLRDVYRICHPKAMTGSKFGIVNYLVRGETKIEHPDLDPILCFEKLKTATDAETKVQLITQGRLPHEVATTFAGKDRKVWEAIVPQMPIFALLKNLATIERNEVVKESKMKIESTFSNEHQIRKSKILPFRFLSAMEKVSTPFIKDSLRDGLELSFHNLPEIVGSSVVFLDISGSMKNLIKTASVFAVALMKKIEEGKLYLFNTSIQEYQISKRDSLLTQAERIKVSGGTETSVTINALLRNNEKYDNIIMFTDEQQNSGNPFCDRLAAYQKRHPNTKTFIIDVSSETESRSLPVDMKNVWYIFGWSPSVLNFISMTSKGWSSMVDLIRNPDTTVMSGDPEEDEA